MVVPFLIANEHGSRFNRKSRESGLWCYHDGHIHDGILCPRVPIPLLLGSKARAVHKPNPVPGSGFPSPGNDHSSVDAGCPTPLATYPGAWAGYPLSPPYLVLHQVGFAKLPRSLEELVRSYRTFSPLPDTQLSS